MVQRVRAGIQARREHGRPVCTPHVQSACPVCTLHALSAAVSRLPAPAEREPRTIPSHTRAQPSQPAQPSRTRVRTGRCWEGVEEGGCGHPALHVDIVAKHLCRVALQAGPGSRRPVCQLGATPARPTCRVTAQTCRALGARRREPPPAPPARWQAAAGAAQLSRRSRQQGARERGWVSKQRCRRRPDAHAEGAAVEVDTGGGLAHANGAAAGGGVALERHPGEAGVGGEIDGAARAAAAHCTGGEGSRIAARKQPPHRAHL